MVENPLPPARVLVADDQADVLAALRLLLKGEGFQVETTTSPAGVLKAVQTTPLDIVLVDLNYTRDTTSGAEGFDLLAKVRAHDASLPVLVMTAWGTLDGAVEAMRRGARDYVQKPWDNARLLASLRTQVALGRALRANTQLSEENSRLREDAVPAFISQSASMRPVLELLERVGPSDANVLLTGEHGTGKEILARRIHEVSLRVSKGLVPVNTGGLSEGLFESELFGHVKGAFTDAKADRAGCFELADGGTLFLDEIANMPLTQQAKLLRVLQTGELYRVGSSKLRRVNVRVVSATNVDLPEEVAAGRFREDLLYRLNTVEIHLPALRERPEDIPLLAEYFLEGQAARYRKDVHGFTPEALEALHEHRWPGNVRELEHAMERAVLLARGDRVDVEDLGLRARKAGGVDYEAMTLEQVERHLIDRALSRASGSVNAAAEGLGLSRSALYRRLQHFGIKTG